MSRRKRNLEYAPVTQSRRQHSSKAEFEMRENQPPGRASNHVFDRKDQWSATAPPDHRNSTLTLLKPGHAFSYAALFLFTLVLYLRPSEIYPSVLTASLALIVGIITLGIFIPTQLSLEGTLTDRPPEINLVMLFGLTAALSIPLAINPSVAWAEFSGPFIRCLVIFIVMVNVVRTEKRLYGLLWLAIAASIWLSLGAINDYRLGLMTVEGYRAGGRGGGMFGNPNDMALHLVTIVPVTIALLLTTRKILAKLVYGAAAFLMVAAIMLTYSRGGFIGLVTAVAFLTFKVAHKRKLEIAICGFIIVAGLLAIAPGGYALRVASIFVPGLDPVGSSDARRAELFRSLYIALRHPLLGIGMGNYGPEMSYRGQATHNSYTQVAAELGMTALVCYMTFILKPLRKLGQITRDALQAPRLSRYYYLSVGLQAALLGYMVSSFFASVAYLWYVFYLVGYAVCLRRLFESETGKPVVVEKRRVRKRAEVPSIGGAGLREAM